MLIKSSSKNSRISCNCFSFLFVLFLAFVPQSSVAAWFDTTSQKRFKGEAMLDLGRLNLDNGMVAAFADINADQFTDILMLSPDQRSLSIWLWDPKQYQLVPSKSDPIRLPSENYITSVIPGDFNYDGRVDLLVLSRKSASDNQLASDLFIGSTNGVYNTSIPGPNFGLAQPLVIDSDGDMRPDLVGVQASSVEGSASNVLWINSLSESNETAFRSSQLSVNGSTFDCEISNPNSNAWVDLDGDCLADLFITCRDPSDSNRLMYQIWTNKKDQGFEKAREGKLPSGTGQVSFVDMDRDGAIDMVYPTCDGTDCKINIQYNTQKPLCTSAAHEDPESCRSAKSLCTAEPSFGFDNDNIQSFSLSKVLSTHPYLVMEDKDFVGDLPFSLKIGDYNHDGYPDILVVSSIHPNPTVGRPAILENVACDHLCTSEETDMGRRSLKKLHKGVASLEKMEDVKSASWIDIDEDGSLDILVQRKTVGGSAARIPVFLKNNFYHDAFFLKAQTSNGACSGVCLPQNENEQPFKPAGVNFAGATYKFIVLESTGQKRATHAPQLPQSAYNVLLTPYTHLGLGRLNNYIESLYVGSTRHQKSHYTAIEGIVPNSQLVIEPYQPQDVQDPGTWTRSLYLQPGDWIPWVGLSVIISTVILGGIVIFLHVNEKREDEAERRRALHRINFDAL